MANNKTEQLPSKIKWMQRFFKLAGEVAPSATLPILVKLLFTPKERPLRPPHRACMKEAEVFRFKTTEFKKPDARISLTCYSWGKGSKLVILLHGWDSMAVDFYKMIPVLVEKGYRVMAFDGPAHGESEGQVTHLMHFRDVLYQFIKKVGQPYAIIGHSMGGGAATYMLMETDMQVEKLVLIAIPIISKKYFEAIFSFMKVPAKMQQLFYKGMNEELGESIDNYNLALRKEPIKANDMLVLYDFKDESIHPKDIKDFLKTHPTVKHKEIKDVGHNGIIKSKDTFEEILSFLQ